MRLGRAGGGWDVGVLEEVQASGDNQGRVRKARKGGRGWVGEYYGLVPRTALTWLRAGGVSAS